jgi:hypothetical protein
MFFSHFFHLAFLLYDCSALIDESKVTEVRHCVALSSTTARERDWQAAPARVTNEPHAAIFSAGITIESAKDLLALEQCVRTHAAGLVAEYERCDLRK